MLESFLNKGKAGQIKIDAVKQRLFRQGKIIVLPWFKPEVELGAFRE
jgi:hypothetical protein